MQLTDGTVIEDSACSIKRRFRSLREQLAAKVFQLTTTRLRAENMKLRQRMFASEENSLTMFAKHARLQAENKKLQQELTSAQQRAERSLEAECRVAAE